MRYLLTPSLYSCWRWYSGADDDGEARAELIAHLGREERPPNEDMLRGRQFEDDIRSVASEQSVSFDDPLYENAVTEIVEAVKGGLWQERIYLDLRFRQHGDFLLYGKIDVLKGPWAHDIKWRRRGGTYQTGQYAKGIQHSAYMAGSGCPKFAFHISDGKTVWREDYFYSSAVYEEMRGRLLDMLDDIARDQELSALYRKHWQADKHNEKPRSAA